MRAFLLAVLLCLSLVACGGAGGPGPDPAVAAPAVPRAAAVATVQIIEAYGESTTYGYGLPPDGVITVKLQSDLPGWVVVNRGVNSTTALQQLDGTDGLNLPWVQQIAQSPAGIVILNRGLNDAFKLVPTDVFRSQMLTLIAVAQAAGKKVILQVPNWTHADAVLGAGFDVRAVQMGGVVRQIASEMSLPLCDGYAITVTALSDGVEALLPDGLHPTGALNAALAADLARLIRGL